MGAEQSLIGGRKRSRSVDSNDNKTFEAYKAVKSMLEEQGKDFEKQVFLDLPDARVLKRLGIFEDCDIGRFDDTECKNSIKNIVIKAHGSLVQYGEDGPLSVTVPENIVVLFMGELGHITWGSYHQNISKNICNKELVPNQIGLPGSTIPNVSLSAEHQKKHYYSTGIYDCDLNKNDILNQFEGLEHYLIPTEEEIIETMKPEVKEMLKNAEQKAKQKGEKIINNVTLNEILPEISEKIPKDKYGFVYVFSCLGVCKWKTQDEIELYTKPTGLSPVRGYTVKKIPARASVSRYSLEDGKEWNPILTNDRDIIDARSSFVTAYTDFDFDDKKFINKFFLKYSAFKFDENWRNHLPDIKSSFIQGNESKLRKNAVVNHFKFIDLLHEGDLEKIEKAWNIQFEDKTKFLLPRKNYITYSKKRNLSENIIDLIDNFKDNKEIFENIDKIEFENPVNKIKNLIKDKNLEDLKKLIFQYMKYAVNGYKEFKNIKYQDIYEDEEEDEEALNVVEAHDIYHYTILFGDFARDDEYFIKNKDRLKNALDIKPYLDYVNSDEYVNPHADNDDVIKHMNRINRIFELTEKEEKILDLFIKDDIKSAKVLLFDYMKEGADDLNVWYIYEILNGGDYPQTIKDMVYIHWNYDYLIRNGEEAGIEDLIANLEPPYTKEEDINSYRVSLDIKPYLDYVKSDEYVHPDKDYVIEKMNELRDALGFPAIQQGGQTGQAGQAGQAGQYGGMWQRGGFFMTCS